jgi:hypothetical protein
MEEILGRDLTGRTFGRPCVIAFSPLTTAKRCVRTHGHTSLRSKGAVRRQGRSLPTVPRGRRKSQRRLGSGGIADNGGTFETKPRSMSRHLSAARQAERAMARLRHKRTAARRCGVVDQGTLQCPSFQPRPSSVAAITGTPQISSAYSRMLRSDENHPICAVFNTLDHHQAWRSRQRSATARWVSA